MSSTKICFVTREYAHPNMGRTGGIGVFLKQFTTELQQHDFNIVVFSFGIISVRFHDANVEVIKIKDLSGFNEWLRTPLRRYKVPGYITIKIILEFINRVYISMYLSVFVIRRQFDLIEFHDYGGDAPFIITNKPKIVRCHGSALTLHLFMGYVNRISDSIFEQQFFKRFHKNVIAVSKYSAEITQKAFNLRELPEVIYNGVSIPKNFTSKEYLDSPTIPFSVFYFGSIRERKGIDLACEVFNSVIKQFPKASFHVLGNNNNDHWNQVAIKILSQRAVDQTTYYGAVPNSEVNSYLEKAHVVLFPSYGENFSIALLEVMALGKIAITSNIPAFKEIIQHGVNGFISNSFEDYMTLVTEVFDNRIDASGIEKQAKLTIIDSFEISNIMKQNVQYYKSILKNE